MNTSIDKAAKEYFKGKVFHFGPYSNRLLETDEDFRQYIEGVLTTMKAKYPASWFNDRVHFGIFYNNSLVGGFGSKLEAPFEKLDALSDTKRDELLLKYRLQDLVQHNGMWLSDKIMSRSLSAALYYFMARRTLQLILGGKKAILFNYNGAALGINSIHRYYQEDVLEKTTLNVEGNQYELLFAYNSLIRGFFGLLFLSIVRICEIFKPRHFSDQISREGLKQVNRS